MYAKLWSPKLRQGDVLDKVPFPIATPQLSQTFQTNLAGSILETLGSPTVAAKPSLVVVVSHDCEFNEGKRTHFLVARIDGFPSELAAVDLAELEAGNDVEQASAAELAIAADTFVLWPLEGLFPQARRINFAAMASIPMKSVDELVKFKKAELQHVHRVLLRKKLGVFFARETDDIADDQKHDPSEPPTAEPVPA